MNEEREREIWQWRKRFKIPDMAGIFGARVFDFPLSRG